MTATRCCLCGMPTAHDNRFCYGHSWAEGVGPGPEQAFERWIQHGRSSPQGLSGVEEWDLYQAFERGWNEAQAGKSDWARRYYTGDERRAYTTGRLLAPRRETR